MFQFPRSTLMQLFIHYMMHGVSHASSLIRKSPDLWLCAPTRSLSQLITSFIACESLGIHRTPFLTSFRPLLGCGPLRCFLAGALRLDSPEAVCAESVLLSFS